jgi:hypothetical protein
MPETYLGWAQAQLCCCSLSSLSSFLCSLFSFLVLGTAGQTRSFPPCQAFPQCTEDNDVLINCKLLVDTDLLCPAKDNRGLILNVCILIMNTWSHYQCYRVLLLPAQLCSHMKRHQSEFSSSCPFF